ncbi:predicted protein [Uncinocarpus reesii 1704]|uniref:RAD52 DNA repair protein RADC n=1 Tax=Uncinocarpus reesii (strain UAMH 1704) TaxID=336963 RepID=C4JSY0_UNCRE|nr:uncharacterized protein UREG_05569 [Uncinocarpus reesii 1704]EEP80727.1 predicted protein [Uncinocarpus reesii 1704]
MPAHGDQHRSYSAAVNAANPFEPPVQRINVYTAQEIATLQSRLDKRLGPEFLSSRAGPGGQRVHYLSADKCISLANEVFGFNGWSSSIQNINIDFDIGYGHIENSKGKAAAFEKAKKEGTTDALKRALRMFGNVLGNCIYDRDYLSKVTKVKAVPARWDVGELHRHTDFVPIKEELVTAANAPRNDAPAVIQDVAEGILELPSKLSNEPDTEIDFGSDAFDEADFGEQHLSHPDEISLDEEPPLPLQNHGGSAPSRPNIQRHAGTVNTHAHAVPNHMVTPSKPPQPPPAPIATTRQSGSTLPAPPDRITRPNIQANQYTTPKAQIPARPPQQSAANDSKPFAGRIAQSNHDLPPPLPCNQHKTNAEPSTGNRGSHSPSKPPSPLGSQTPQGNPQMEPGVWYSARAANMTEQGKPAPTFDPKCDSPSIRKTLSITHAKSAPVSRKTFQNVEAQISSQTPHKPNSNNGPLASQSSTYVSPRMGADTVRRARAWYLRKSCSTAND